jgi:spore maturation protein CgeB
LGTFYAEGFALHIAETLVAMGHTVARFEPSFRSNAAGTRLGVRLNQARGVIHSATDAIPALRARRMRPLWQLVDERPFDVVVVCHDFLWPEEVAELKRRSRAKLAMWFPDAAANIGKGFFMNAEYDGLFFKDPYLVEAFSGVLPSPVHYLPECFNPARHQLPEGETPGPEYQCDITTAGNPHSWRVAFYKHLARYNVKLWGPPPPLWLPLGPVAAMYQRRGVLNQDKARAFLGAKVVLNNLHYGEIWGLNARTFEAAGVGAFQMVDWRPGLAHLFEDGVELVSFRGLSDCKRKLDHYLNHEDERLTIARAGKVRAGCEHTYAHRLSLLLGTLEGSASGHSLPSIGYV